MTSDEKDQLLDRYVSGHPMNTDEETQVNRLLQTDPAFNADYRLRQALFEAGKQQRRAAWEARPQVRPLPVKQTVFPMRWAAAASVVLLLGLGLFWWVRSADSQPITGQAPLFEQRDTHLGLAGNDSSAVGTVAWIVTKGSENEYEFSQVDTLRIFTTDPGRWKDKDQTWRLTRLSETRYQLRVDDRTYLLEQGRSLRLPLQPKQ